MSTKQRNRANKELNGLQAALNKNPNDIESRLSLAEYYLSHNQTDQISGTVAPCREQYREAESLQQARIDRLIAFVSAAEGKSAEAEEALERAVAVVPDCADLYFVRAYVALHLSEYDNVIESASRCLELWGDTNREKQIPELSPDDGYRSQLLNILGSAYRDKNRLQEAEENFRSAIESAPDNHLPYLNLSNLLRQTERREEGEQIIRTGLKKCKQVHELRMLAQTIHRNATVAACMIVRNEEELLPGCLDSIRDWVDELIVVDTGSTDSTVEISESYGAKLHRQEWTNDFSYHRNYSIEQADSEWILIIDADERLVRDDIPSLQTIINDGQYAAISLNVINVYGREEEKTTFLNSVRLFTKDSGLRYDGIVHNRLQIPNDMKVLRTRARIKHLGYDLTPEKMQAKFDRSRALLERQLTENENDHHALYNLAQLLLAEARDNWSEYGPQIIELADRAIALTSPDNRKTRPTWLMGHVQAAYAHYYLDNQDEAIAYASKALEAKPDYLDALMLMGHAYGKKKEYTKSNEFYGRYLETQKKLDLTNDRDSLILFHPESLAEAYYNRGMNRSDENDYDGARDDLSRAAKANPNYYDVQGQLGRLCMRAGDAVAAGGFFEKQLEADANNALALLGMANIAIENNDRESFDSYHSQLLNKEINQSESTLFYHFAKGYLSTGQTVPAIELLETICQSSHATDEIRVTLANAYFKMEQFERALSQYGTIGASYPDQAGVKNQIGNCHFKLGQFDQARETYRDAIDSYNVESTVYRNLGVVELKIGNNEAAISAFEEFLRCEPKNIEILLLLAELNLRLERYQDAIAISERILSIRPRNPMAIYALSESYLLMGHQDSAILGYRKVLEIDPDFAPAKERLEQISSGQILV